MLAAARKQVSTSQMQQYAGSPPSGTDTATAAATSASASASRKAGKKRVRNFTADDRAAHRIFEKSRREAFKERLTELAGHVPSLADTDPQRLSKHVVVEESIARHHLLQQHCLDALQDVRALLRERDELLAEVNARRRAEGTEPRQPGDNARHVDALAELAQEIERLRSNQGSRSHAAVASGSSGPPGSGSSPEEERVEAQAQAQAQARPHSQVHPIQIPRRGHQHHHRRQQSDPAVSAPPPADSMPLLSPSSISFAPESLPMIFEDQPLAGAAPWDFSPARAALNAAPGSIMATSSLPAANHSASASASAPAPASARPAPPPPPPDPVPMNDDAWVFDAFDVPRSSKMMVDFETSGAGTGAGTGTGNSLHSERHFAGAATATGMSLSPTSLETNLQSQSAHPDLFAAGSFPVAGSFSPDADMAHFAPPLLDQRHQQWVQWH